MLDSQVVSYLEVGREARGLALRLERLSRGERRPRDLQLVKGAAETLRGIARGEVRARSGSVPSVAFATPQGLGVVLHAAEEVFRTDEESAGGQGGYGTKDPVVFIADLLEAIVADARQTAAISKEVRQQADRCRRYFRNVHDTAHEIIALDLDAAPITELERAMASTP